jgi:tetrahydromethanopterin S-methyltransferase subunit G
MKISKMLRIPGTCSLIVSLLVVNLQAPAMADMVDTSALNAQAELQTQRDDVRSFIARDDVRAAMLDYGVSTADIDARIDNLSTSELAQLQGQFAELPAGGGVLGVVVGIILIFILLDLLGATDVFPRI